jgi:hypothetical protein
LKIFKHRHCRKFAKSGLPGRICGVWLGVGSPPGRKNSGKSHDDADVHMAITFRAQMFPSRNLSKKLSKFNSKNAGICQKMSKFDSKNAEICQKMSKFKCGSKNGQFKIWKSNSAHFRRLRPLRLKSYSPPFFIGR